ncbi:hypothetical protein HNQ87_002035 [Pacificimonas flava]|nr:hypothetical protein [Pacificimonas flava]
MVACLALLRGFEYEWAPAFAGATMYFGEGSKAASLEGGLSA